MATPARIARTALALACALGGAACSSAPDHRPNLLLVTVDTLRPDRLACYGGRAGVGPALCAIGQQGLRYRWALSPAPSTAPAIASILTSLYPSDHGVSQFAVTQLADEVTSVAEVLRDAGYHTAAIVGNPVLLRPRGLGQGFDVYDDRMQRPEGNRAALEREAREATDAALDWARVVEAPWFLWIHYQDPHGPYAPPGAGPARDPDPGERLPVLTDHSGKGGIPAYQALPGLHTREGYEARYRAEIVHLDIQLARLVSELDAGPRNLGILLTADHGEAFGEDGYYLAHGHSVGLEQIRVPLLWRPPQPLEAGMAIDHPVSTLDVAPTLLQAAGIAPPAGFLGRPLGGAEDADPDRVLFAEHRARAAAVIGRRYYARDRRALDPPERDRITGGWLEPLPPRTARLGDADLLPAYALSEDAGTLEQALAAHLAASPATGPDEGGGVSDETREQLRALGYLE